MNIILANPRSFCSGVKRAINIVEYVLMMYNHPIYVLNEIVHNKYVVNSLIKKGVIFVKNINKVPDGSVLIFSAHGVSKKVQLYSKDHNLIVFDATCPLVKKVHSKIINASIQNIEVIFIGKKNHPETKGSIGQYSNTNCGIYVIESEKDIINLKIKNLNNLLITTQTTLSVIDTNNIIKKLRKKFPLITIKNKNNICYATINRQNSLINLAKISDIILIIGSKNSSNSNRLLELAKRICKFAYLIDNLNDIKKFWFDGINNIGITAGASAPEILVKKIIEKLKLFNIKNIKELYGHKEKIIFKLPKNILFKIKKLNLNK